jgi:Ca-activated chloride channel family protein
MRTRALLLSVVLAGAAGAQGVLLPRCPIPQRGAEIVCRTPAQVQRTRTDVRIRLVDKVLRYEVEEHFINRGSTVGEADYVFPLPRNAAFQDLSLEINGELVNGETYSADEARRMYEEIVRKMRDPALVEFMGQGMLRTRIFPIAPGEEKRVVIHFQAVAEREGDALRVDYFGGTRPEPGRAAMTDASPVHLQLEYADNAGLGRAYSPTHELDVSDRGSAIQAVVKGDARDATILIPTTKSSAASMSVLTNAPGREDGFVMVRVTPPESRSLATTPRDITLVLDVSGSMQGTKMDQARAAGRQLLETLRPEDRFRLIDFSTDVHTFRDEFVYATRENVNAARRYLDDLEATGSTNIEAALREAVRVKPTSNRLPLVLFVTDGAPTVGERDPLRLADIGHRDGATQRIFTFGLGADVNVTLLEQLALEGRGTSQFVRPEESVERSVSLVASRLVDPVLTDIRVTADGVSLNKVLPANGGDLFAGQDLVVLGRYRGTGSGTIRIEGRRNGQPVVWTMRADFPDRQPENGFVARLWAAQRIGFLSAERRRADGSSELDTEIRTLGERFSLPTEFTSYFVREPGNPMMHQARIGGMGAGSAAAPAPPAAVQFEAARRAADQRAATTAAALDATPERQNGGGTERLVSGHTFRLADGTWTDIQPAGSRKEVTVRAFSKAYFDLLSQIPELKDLLSIGDQVTVVGRGIVISIRTDKGLDTLSQADLKSTIAAW